MLYRSSVSSGGAKLEAEILQFKWMTRDVQNRFSYLHIYRIRFVVAQSGIERCVREVGLNQVQQTIDNHQILFSLCGPHIMRHQIACPNDVIDILVFNNFLENQTKIIQ